MCFFVRSLYGFSRIFNRFERVFVAVIYFFFLCIFLPSTRLLCPNCNVAARDGQWSSAGDRTGGEGRRRNPRCYNRSLDESDPMTTIARRRSQGRPPAIRGSVTHIGRNALRWSAAASLSLPSPPPIWHRLCANRVSAGRTSWSFD